MALLIQLFDEKTLLTTLQSDTLEIIRDCKSIDPIKKLVECHEILRLTQDIQERFPRVMPEPPTCDEAALLHLKNLTQEIFVFYHPELPRPTFDTYTIKIKQLLWTFRIPRWEFKGE